MNNKASLACQVKANIRCVKEMKYPAVATIFKNEEMYDEEKHEIYFLGFFEELYPKLIKNLWQNKIYRESRYYSFLISYVKH